MCPWVSYKKKIYNFFCILEVTEEKSRIRSWIWIRTKMSQIPNTANNYTFINRNVPDLTSQVTATGTDCS
jgi:hypothetical protein